MWIDDRIPLHRSCVYPGRVAAGVGVVGQPRIAVDMAFQDKYVPASCRNHSRRRRGSRKFQPVGRQNSTPAQYGRTHVSRLHNRRRNAGTLPDGHRRCGCRIRTPGVESWSYAAQSHAALLSGVHGRRCRGKRDVTAKRKNRKALICCTPMLDPWCGKDGLRKRLTREQEKRTQKVLVDAQRTPTDEPAPDHRPINVWPKWDGGPALVPSSRTGHLNAGLRRGHSICAGASSGGSTSFRAVANVVRE